MSTPLTSNQRLSDVDLRELIRVHDAAPGAYVFGRQVVDCLRELQERRAADGLCPHGLPLAENICGPCSQGRPMRAVETAAPRELSTVELLNERDRINAALAHRVLGDPRESVSIGSAVKTSVPISAPVAAPCSTFIPMSPYDTEKCANCGASETVHLKASPPVAGTPEPSLPEVSDTAAGVDPTPEHLRRQGYRSGKITIIGVDLASGPDRTAYTCSSCGTELAFANDICGLCHPEVQP